MDCGMKGSSVLHYLPEFVDSCPLSQWCYLTTSSSGCPLLFLPSIFPSIRVFPIESALHFRWPKFWSFSFSISPSNEYSWFSFRIYLFDLLAIQGTLKSLLQHHSLKASILWCSAFFMVQLLHPHMTTGKKHSLDYTELCWQSDVSACNVLSRFVIALFPRSKLLLISWLQVTVCSDCEAQEDKISHCFHFFFFNTTLCFLSMVFEDSVTCSRKHWV